MNTITDAAITLQTDYLWLIEILAYLIIASIALLLWRYLRRRIFIHRHWQMITAAISAPITFFIIGTCLCQIARSIANRFTLAFLESLNSEASQTIVVVTTFFWGMLRLLSVAEKIYDRPININDAKIDASTVHAGFRLARYIVIIIAAITAIDSLGYSITGFLAFGGIGGAVIAFAAQKTLANIFSGLIIFTERPFVIGDWIRCPGTHIEGVVKDIGWRTTQLETFDKRPLYVPNSLFSENSIENPQRMLNRRIYEYMGLRYQDIAKMPAILADIRQMINAHPNIAQQEIQMVNFDQYGESSINFFIYAMTQTTEWAEFHHIKEDVLFKIAKIVERHNAEFAFPTRTLHLTAEHSDSIASQLSKTNN